MPSSLAVQPPAPEQIPQPRAGDRCPLNSHLPLLSLAAPKLVPRYQTRWHFILRHCSTPPCPQLCAGPPAQGASKILGWGQDIHSVPVPSACPAMLIPPLPGKGEKLSWEVVGKQQPQPAPAHAQEFCKCSTCTNFFMAVFTVVPCKKWTCVSLLIT